MTPAEFLAAHGFGAAVAEPLPSDASGRRYTRLLGGPAPALLVDAGRPPCEDLGRFAAIAHGWRAAGLAVPAILAARPGLLLVEDLGRATLADALDAGADPVPLYAAAGGALAALHATAPLPGLPAWDGAAMAAATAATLLDWWWPAAFGAPAPAAARADLDAAIQGMLAPFAGSPRMLHRDYFPPNLIAGPGGIGMIDFQDAGVGPAAYDLVSLVEDARRDVVPAARAAAVAAYAAAGGAPDPAEMAVCAAQRHLRVAALWVRLAVRDARPGYLRHGPRTWAQLDRALAHPATAPLRLFLDRHIPPELRANPPVVCAEAAA